MFRAMKIWNGAIAIAVVLWAGPVAAADIVTLDDGRWIEGKVEVTGAVVKVEMQYGTVEIPSEKVKNILKDGDDDGNLDRERKKERERIEQAIEEMQKHSAWRDAYEEETKHFVFKYNVTPEIAQGYIEMLEGFYGDFCKELGVRLGPGIKRKKMEVNIFRDKGDFDQVGGVPGAAGFFNFVDERLFFYHDRNDQDYTLSVLLHEFTHLLTHLIKPKFCHPIWCNEGIAEYYGASRREGNKLVFGGIQEGRLVGMNRWREEGNDYGLEQLMRTPPSGFGGLEYAWAWSFVHFAMNTPNYTKKFMKYYKGLAAGSGVQHEEGTFYYPSVRASNDVEYFKKCFGLKSLDKLDKEWHDYIDTQLKVTSGAGYLRQALSLFWEDKNEEALEAVNKAEASWEGLPSPNLYVTKGRILADMNRHEEAQAAFQKALELDPINARYYYYLGDSMEDMHKSEVLQEAIRLKNLAHELAPDDYDLRYMVERDDRNRKERAAITGKIEKEKEKE